MQREVSLLLLSVGLLLPACSRQGDEPAAGTNAPPPSASQGNPITAPVDYLGAVAKAQKSSGNTLSLVGVQQAINLFNTQEGRFPTNLNELVSPDYLPQLPTPPAGMKFSYDPSTGKVKTVPR
jgi:hypothetical protein